MLNVDKDDLLLAGAISGPAVVELLNRNLMGTSTVDSRPSTTESSDVETRAQNSVQIAPNGSINLTVNGENTGNTEYEIWVGVTIEGPRGNDDVNLRPFFIPLQSQGDVSEGGTFSAELDNLSTDRQGNNIFAATGTYDIRVLAYSDANAQNPISPSVLVSEAISVEEIKSASIGNITVDGVTVRQG